MIWSVIKIMFFPTIGTVAFLLPLLAVGIGVIALVRYLTKSQREGE